MLVESESELWLEVWSPIQYESGLMVTRGGGAGLLASPMRRNVMGLSDGVGVHARLAPPLRHDFHVSCATAFA